MNRPQNQSMQGARRIIAHRLRPRATMPPDCDEHQADRDAVGGGRRARSDDRRRDDVRRPPRRRRSSTAPNTTAIELQGAELAAEIARCARGCGRPIEPQEPARNLFQFSAQRASRAAAAAPARPTLEPPAVAAAPPPPPLVAHRIRAPRAPIRTAIISGFGDLFLVKEGDRIAGAVPREPHRRRRRRRRRASPTARRSPSACSSREPAIRNSDSELEFGPHSEFVIPNS